MKHSFFPALLASSLVGFLQPLAAETSTPYAEPQTPEVKAALETLEVQPVQLESLDQKGSYMLGNRHGRSMVNSEIKVDVQAYLAGFRDALNQQQSKLSSDQVKAITQEMATIRRRLAEEKQARVKEENLAAAEKFLAENKSKEGVITSPSGLQYKVITPGIGNAPAASSNVEVHYRGRLMDGTEFDSSYKRNTTATFNVGGVIKGWTEGLQLMQPGAKYEFYIHPSLGYGQNPQPSIPANSLLIFEVELIAVK
jgi:FKBP-type peptidyl-prolyl cis-trans isomerase